MNVLSVARKPGSIFITVPNVPFMCMRNAGRST